MGAAAARGPRGPGSAALLRVALELADECAGAVRAALERGLEVESKPDASLVTSADRAAERVFREGVARRFPRDGVLGEEAGLERPRARRRWIVDPVDGTAELVRGVASWGIIIGLHEAGVPRLGVIDHPALGVRVHAARGLGTWLGGRRIRLAEEPPAGMALRLGLPPRRAFVRRGDDGDVFDRLARAFPETRTFHTCYTHTLAATGGLDATVEWDLPEWDLAAARILAEEADGAYVVLRERDHGELGRLRCVVLGRRAAVAAVVGAVGRLA